MKTNALYYGDNLEVIHKYIPDESIDLIYIDPPFFSSKAYEVIYKDTKEKRMSELMGKTLGQLTMKEIDEFTKLLDLEFRSYKARVAGAKQKK